MVLPASLASTGQIARLRNFLPPPSVLPPAPFMKTKIPLVVVLLFSLLTVGCATRNTASGGKETSVLGGAVTVSTESFQPVKPATVNADTSKFVGKNGPSGKKVSLLWGVITLHDY